MKTPTPRTDAEITRIKNILNRGHPDGWKFPIVSIDVNLARELERELIAANAQIKAIRRILENIDAQGRPHTGGDTGCGCEQCDNYDAVELSLKSITVNYPTP
jgi:hypothetical protein